jgi:hypothetical protein
MGFRTGDGILHLVQAMKSPMRTLICVLAAALLAGGVPFRGEAKSYSSGGGHSYSSHSSSFGGGHSFSSGSSHSFSSGGSHSSSSGAGRSSSGGFTHSSSSSGGTSYSSGSTSSDAGRHSYTSGKSYSSGASHTFASTSGNDDVAIAIPSPRTAKPDSSVSQFTFDQAAARARKEEVSRTKFTQFKESQLPPVTAPSEVARSTAPNSTPDAPSYRVKPPPLPGSTGGSGRPVVYVPDAGTLSSRPVRIYNVFNPYISRPVVIYRDPYNSLFWWWLLDRSLDDRAWWAYHHRYDMDPARYQALVAQDQQLEARVQQLEAQQAPRNPNYAPPGVDQDLMYTDRHVQRAYSNRPTSAGVVAFWLLAVPLALGVSGFFIWLIWFKRWQPATPQPA